MTVWMAIVLAGVGTYLIRVSMLLMLTGDRVSPRIEQSLTAVAPAVVGVMVAGAFLDLGHPGRMRLDHLAAAATAFVVVRRTGRLTDGALVGMVMIWAVAAAGAV